MRAWIRGLCVVLGMTLAVPHAWAKEEFGPATLLQNAAVATGDGVILSTTGYNAAVVKLSVSGATVTWETGGADSDWTAIPCSLVGSNANGSTASTSGLYICNVAGMTGFRARISSYTSGSVTVTAQLTTAYAGANSGFLFDSAGNLQVNLNTLLACENQTYNLCMTSGGAVRSTTMASAVTTNTTSAVTQPPTGSKSIQGILTCNAGGSTNCGITFTVYGSALNTQATGTKVTLCTATIPTGAAVTSEACPVITAAYLYMWIETTDVAGTSPSLTVTAMY